MEAPDHAPGRWPFPWEEFRAPFESLRVLERCCRSFHRRHMQRSCRTRSLWQAGLFRERGRVIWWGTVQLQCHRRAVSQAKIAIRAGVACFRPSPDCRAAPPFAYLDRSVILTDAKVVERVVSESPTPTSRT